MPEYSPQPSPESNGRAERLNRMFSDKARTLFNPLGPDVINLWAEAVATANYIRNRMFSSGCQLRAVIPIEGLTEIKPSVAHLRKFGGTAFLNIPAQL